MKKLLAPFRLLYKIYFGLVFYASLTLLYPAFWVTTRRPEWYPICFKLKRFWGLILQVSLLIYIKKEQKNPLPKTSYVIACNHSSYLDIVFMYRLFTNKFIFLGKKELLKWPLFKTFFKTMDIAVDRHNRIKAAKGLIKAKKYLRSGFSIAIFPEGTIPENVPIMKRFKDGAFKLAIEEQVPVVPVTYLNNWKLFSDPSMTFGPASPGIAKVIIHAPVQTEGMTQQDLVSLRQMVFDTIEAPLKEYNKQAYVS